MKKVVVVVLVIIVGYFLLNEYTYFIDKEEYRTVDCSICHGNGICYHCDGDKFRNGRRCRICNGAGTCSNCGGSGSFLVYEKDNKDYIICGSCKGEGICKACNGEGEKYYYSSSIFGNVEGKCMVCNGSGKCLRCKGSGLVELRGF